MDSINKQRAMHEMYFTCRKCGTPFINQSVRFNHESVCPDIIFEDDDILDIELPEQIEQPETYRSLLAKAAERDPAYKKYLNRVDIGEPNGVAGVYRKLKKGEAWKKEKLNEVLRATRSAPVKPRRLQKVNSPLLSAASEHDKLQAPSGKSTVGTV